MIGVVEPYQRTHIRVEVPEEERGKGIGTQEVIRFFESLAPGTEIFIYVNEDNPASIRMMEKSGAEYRGRVHAYRYVK